MKDTGFSDNNGVTIFEGDKMIIPKHLDSSCCVHKATCTVKFNAEWNKYGLGGEE